jgi:GNAT superfamily N-acetyltransferase
MSGAARASAVEIRRATPADATVCGSICYEAFAKVNREHGFEPDIPSAEMATGLLSLLFSRSEFYSVVAEREGRIVGSNCMDERSVIGGIGPLTIDPAAQDRGVGRRLMQAVLDRAAERRLPGVRLVQGAFHNRSLSLYTKLGFDAREPLSVLSGPPMRIRVDGASVRRAGIRDIEPANRICELVHGLSRAGELRDAVREGWAVVVERQGRITGYASMFGYQGHAVGECNLDLQALIASAETVTGPGIIVPTRNSELLRWCLERGLKIKMPLTLMSIGLYNEPDGAYLPSILY